MRRAAQLVELRSELVRYDPQRGLAIAPLLEEIRRLFDSHNAILYHPEPLDTNWELDFSIWVGPNAEGRRDAHRGFVRRSPLEAPCFAAYDPFAIQAAQRNRALTVRSLFALELTAEKVHRHLWHVIDGKQQDQVRVIVCQGPRMLGWFGLMRDAPFTEAEVRAFQSLVAPLRSRLMADREARSVVSAGTLLEGVLEALPDAAFIFDRFGRVEWLNSRAEALLDGPAPSRQNACELLAAVRRKDEHPDYVFTRLDSHGCSGYTLATRTATVGATTGVVEHAGRLWKITPVQARVLERLAIGESNKQIAAVIQCAEVTVERHVTSLLRASGASSRTELLARLIALGRERA